MKKNILYLSIIILIIMIAIISGNNNNEKKSAPKITQPQISQEQQVQTAQDSKTNVQQKALFPVKELINKTPSEIENLTGAKMIDIGINITGTLMNATIDLQGLSIETSYTLIKHPKVKYNGTIFFNIWFDNPVNKDEAWKIVGLPKPNKEQSYTHSTNNSKFTWRNIPPFFEIQAGHPYQSNTLIVDKNKIEFIECYLLTEDENIKLYQ